MARSRQHTLWMRGTYAAGSKVRSVFVGRTGLKSFVGKVVHLTLTPEEAEEYARKLIIEAAEARKRAGIVTRS